MTSAIITVLAIGPASLKVFFARRLRHSELLKQHVGVGVFEIVPGVFLLRLQKNVAVSYALRAFAAVEVEIENVLDALDVHGEPFNP